MPTISTVVCTYNRAPMLKKTLESLAAQKTGGLFTAEIVVVDDASTDNTRIIAEDFSMKASLTVTYFLGEGMGYTHAVNKGLKEARGDWIVFFDDDQTADDNWLMELYLSAVNNGVLISGGRIVLCLPEKTNFHPGPVVRALYGEYPIFRDLKKKNTKPEPPNGNRIINRKVYDETGGFDESILTGGCDKDFITRALSKGFGFAYTDKAVVYHHIPDDRLNIGRIKHYSFQIGSSMAYINRKNGGILNNIFWCVVRFIHGLTVNLTKFLTAYILGKKAEINDNKARLWIMEGYLRKTLCLLSPSLFGQKEFFNKIEFRRLRT